MSFVDIHYDVVKNLYGTIGLNSVSWIDEMNQSLIGHIEVTRKELADDYKGTCGLKTGLLRLQIEFAVNQAVRAEVSKNPEEKARFLREANNIEAELIKLAL